MTPRAVHQRLLAAYGPQGWWPGDGPFEVMVGAVLTQNTSWRNAERAIGALRAAGALAPRRLAGLPERSLAALLRPAGYFNVKAARLRALSVWVVEAGGCERLRRLPTPTLRRRLLAVHGVGPETADAILLYAFARPVFVVDAYARRLVARFGWGSGGEPYETLRAWFEARLPRAAPVLNEHHALIVRHGKEVCRPRPRCGACVLRARCPAAVFDRMPAGR